MSDGAFALTFKIIAIRGVAGRQGGGGVRVTQKLEMKEEKSIPRTKKRRGEVPPLKKKGEVTYTKHV